MCVTALPSISLACPESAALLVPYINTTNYVYCEQSTELFVKRKGQLIDKRSGFFIFFFVKINVKIDFSVKVGVCLDKLVRIASSFHTKYMAGINFQCQINSLTITIKSKRDRTINPFMT